MQINFLKMKCFHVRNQWPEFHSMFLFKYCRLIKTISNKLIKCSKKRLPSQGCDVGWCLALTEEDKLQVFYVMSRYLRLLYGSTFALLQRCSRWMDGRKVMAYVTLKTYYYSYFRFTFVVY
jgi:hypothetical protein